MNTGKIKHLETILRHQVDKRDKIDQRIAEIQAEIAQVIEECKPPPPVVDQHAYCGKFLYTSKKAAGDAMSLINRDLKKKGAELLRRSYFCELCEAWHLTTIEVYNESIK